MGLFFGNRVGNKLKTCQDAAVAQGMILGEPTTKKWVLSCLTADSPGKRGGLFGTWGNLGNKGVNYLGGEVLKTCQDSAVAQGMVLGQPNTIKWVTNCLKEGNTSTGDNTWVVPPNAGPTPITTIPTSTVQTAGFMGLPTILWIAIAGGAIYYGNKTGMFKKLLK